MKESKPSINDNSFKNISDSFEKEDSLNKKYIMKRNFSQPKLNINGANLEKEHNKATNIKDIFQIKEPKDTIKNDTDISQNNNNDISIQNNSTGGNVQIKENINDYNSYKPSYSSNKCPKACTYIMNFVDCLNFAITIAIIVLLVKIYKWTDENPLEIYDNMNNIKSSVQPMDVLTDILTESQIASDFENDSSGLLKNSLRHLSTDCNELNEKVSNNGGEMHQTFDLGFDMVHKMALGILILYIIYLASILLTILSSFATLCCGKCALVCLVPSLTIVFLASLFSGIISLILFIIMLVNYY